MEKHPGTWAKTPCSRSCHGRRAADGAAKKKTAHAFSPTCQTSKGQGQVGAKQGIISPESTATKQGDGASMPTNRCHTEERSDAARRPAAEERRGVESERQEGLAVRARFESPCGSPVWGSSTLGSHKLWPCGTRRRLLDTHSVDKQTSRPSTALSAFSHGSNPNGRVYKKVRLLLEQSNLVCGVQKLQWSSGYPLLPIQGGLSVLGSHLVSGTLYSCACGTCLRG